MIDWSFLSVTFDSIEIPVCSKRRCIAEDMIFSLNDETFDKTKEFCEKSAKEEKCEIKEIIVIASMKRPRNYKLYSRIWSVLDAECDVLLCPFTIYLSKQGLLNDNIVPYNSPVIECNYDEDSVEYAIMNDNVEKVVFLSSEEGFYDTIVELSIADAIDILSFAAFCGSSKVFRYLLANSKELGVTKCTTEFAIKGGNHEIIEILAQNEYSFNNHLSFAIEFHHNSIAKWLVENYECEQISIEVPLMWSNTFFFILMVQNIEYIPPEKKEELEYVCSQMNIKNPVINTIDNK